MIRLRDLITEISLASVAPYATQFVWTDRYGDGESWQCNFEADSQPITMTMMHWKRSQHGDSGEWQFAYFVRTQDGQGWTTSVASSSARGALNTLRLFKTLGEAIRDFADTVPGVDVIDVTGGDGAANKETQKTRIYTELFRANPDLAAFNLVQGATRLFLVRKDNGAARPDASGIDTPGVDNM
jgi:hypothetical protein